MITLTTNSPAELADTPCWSVIQEYVFCLLPVCFLTLLQNKKCFPVQENLGDDLNLSDITSESTVSAPQQDQLLADLSFSSALNPGDHVVKQEEDQDQAPRDVAEDATVVSAGPDHGGETLHAAAQQARRTQEV